MYVVNLYSHTVSVVSTTTPTLSPPIAVGDYPHGIAFDPVHNRMYVTGGVCICY